MAAHSCSSAVSSIPSSMMAALWREQLAVVPIRLVSRRLSAATSNSLPGSSSGTVEGMGKWGRDDAGDTLERRRARTLSPHLAQTTTRLTLASAGRRFQDHETLICASQGVYSGERGQIRWNGASIQVRVVPTPAALIDLQLGPDDIPFPSSSSPCRQGLQPSSHYRRRTPRVLSLRASILQLLLNLGKDGGNNVIVSIDVEPGAKGHEICRELYDGVQHLNVDAYLQEPTADAAGPITRLRRRPKDGQTVANRVHAQDGVEECGDDASRWHFDEGDEGDVRRGKPAPTKETVGTTFTLITILVTIHFVTANNANLDRRATLDIAGLLSLSQYDTQTGIPASHSPHSALLLACCRCQRVEAETKRNETKRVSGTRGREAERQTHDEDEAYRFVLDEFMDTVDAFGSALHYWSSLRTTARTLGALVARQ
ncbi:hypothetical protein EYR40_010579 [Pleurotus pulmonarius]|nr:hypothetical protein EYR40_010579 [Pleurotus pulmonarius]